MTDFATTDVVVLGGGVIGAATALALAGGTAHRPAVDTLLLDARRPGHTRGSSHGDGRIVRFTYAEAVYLELARRAYEGWQKVQTDSATPILETTGGWEHGPADSLVLDELVRALDETGIAYQELSAAESRRRFPQLRPADDGRILFQPEGAIARADAAVQALWRLATGAGATTWQDRQVDRLEAIGDRLRILGPGFEIDAAAVVIAAGGWTPRLLRQPGEIEPLDLPLTVCREVVAYFPEAADSTVDHGLGHMPTVIDYHDPETPFYSLPRIDIAGVKIGWHHTGPETDPETDPDADHSIVERVQRYVELRMPHLRSEPIAVATCLYTNTPDYHFVVDRHPAHSNVVIATGFSGHGFKFAPALGDVLADLAMERDPGLDLTTFAIDRMLHGGALARRRGA